MSSQFVARHQAVITGILHCWDRVRFSGTVRTLQSVRGLMGYLWQKQVLLKNFKEFTTELTSRVRREGEVLAKAAGRPITFLRGHGARKDEIAREVAARDGIREGLIGLWTSTEPCLTYFLRRDAARRELCLEFAPGKCLHHYFYFLHPIYGLMHLRLQTWFPFNVTLCLNGHEWLARQMDAEGLGYTREENCFRSLENPQRAQALADLQQRDGVATDVGERVARILSQPPGDLSSGGPILLLECQGKRILQRRALCLPAGFGQGLSKLGALRDRTLR